jgi:hypothetical protein
MKNLWYQNPIALHYFKNTYFYEEFLQLWFFILKAYIVKNKVALCDFCSHFLYVKEFFNILPLFIFLKMNMILIACFIFALYLQTKIWTRYARIAYICLDISGCLRHLGRWAAFLGRVAYYYWVWITLWSFMWGLWP